MFSRQTNEIGNNKEEIPDDDDALTSAWLAHRSCVVRLREDLRPHLRNAPSEKRTRKRRMARRTLNPQSFFDDGIVRELCDELGVKIDHAYALWYALLLFGS